MICLKFLHFPCVKGRDLDKIKLINCEKSMIKSCLKSMDSTWSHYYNVLKRVSSLAGQWPYQRPKIRLLAVSLITLSIFSINVPQVIKDFYDNTDIVCVQYDI